jgi:hypothetical protein
MVKKPAKKSSKLPPWLQDASMQGTSTEFVGPPSKEPAPFKKDDKTKKKLTPAEQKKADAKAKADALKKKAKKGK